MNTTSTYWASIYVGGLPYEDVWKIANDICQDYVDRVGLCVSVTSTKYIYTNGSEMGVTVKLINYPRFPSTPTKIHKHAIALASLLKKKLKQKRVSIEFPDKTIMLGHV